jgi:transcriptional regulator with XRE-family HTH domain
MNYNKIGEKIRLIREKELQLSREEFAEELGISTSTVVRLENSNKKITNIEIYNNISNITGYTIEELLNVNSPPNKALKNKLNFLLDGLSDYELICVYEILQNLIKCIKNPKVS